MNITLLLILLSLPVMIISSQQVLAKENRSLLYSIDEKPFNTTYPDWSVKWWKWLQEQPLPNNPAVDQDGRNCGVGQSSEVFFLTGSLSGEADRKCEIPFGKSNILHMGLNVPKRNILNIPLMKNCQTVHKMN